MAAKTAKWELTTEGIRQEIQAGTYTGGLALDVGELAGKYRTTKPTVGKALEALSGDGLVVKDGDAWRVAEDLFPVARIEARTQAKTVAGVEVVVHTPEVLAGRVVTEHVDPNAVRALEREGVAKAYAEAKDLGREWLRAEGRATEAKKAVAAKLMDLRGMFTYRGDPDYNGQSSEYQALAALYYQDIGADRSAQRAILHHVEDRKRDVIPPDQWDRFGVEALTRGERAGLEKKAAKALTAVTETARATAGEARKGKATGHQLLTLASQIEHGVAVFSVASLRVMTPEQRQSFRDKMQATRDQADAALRELEGLDE